MEVLLSTSGMVSLITLTFMEVILGIDNIIFISILASKLPRGLRDQARKTGLIGAMFLRLGLLSIAAWIVGLTKPLFSLMGFGFSGKALILLFGGLFLLYKSTSEIHAKMEPDKPYHSASGSKATFAGVLIQILLMDLVFSIDSVITAVGMTHHLLIMVLANIIALVVMLIASKGISDFVTKHPTVKMLALSFLLLIGTMLIAEAFHFEVPKGYIYFAMGFSAFVEFLNFKSRRNKSRLIHQPKLKSRTQTQLN